MNEIIVRHGDVTKLAKICSCSIQSVRFALKGSVNSDLAIRIRIEAMRLSGIEIKRRKRMKSV